MIDRKKLVADLLASSRQTAGAEAEIIRAEKDPTPDFVFLHLRRYILNKFLLSDSCEEEDLKSLALLSLARTLKLDKTLVRELDQATPCDHATSESTKKVLLLYAVQKDLGIEPDPAELAGVKTVPELSRLVLRCLNKSGAAGEDGSASEER